MMKNMIAGEIHPAYVNALAEKLLGDIRQRGLGVGDRYLTTDVASRMLGVRKAIAGKAMRHLAERQILITKPRGGTFIGPGLTKRSRSKVQTVIVLLPTGDPVNSHWSSQPFITGIRNELPGANVQFTFIPDNDPVSYVRELIDDLRTLGHFAGVVSVSCPPEVYRFLAELHVPAVVYGTLYSSDLPIASVDLDNFQCGRLLAQYLVSRGHRRMALVMTGAGRPGNNRFLDGIGDALAMAGLGPSPLIHRLVSNDIEALRAIAKELLESADRPTAIITRGCVQGSEVASVASSLGLAVPDDLEIVFDHVDETTPHIDVSRYPRVESKSSFAQIAAIIGGMLKEMSGNIPSSRKCVVLPVEFHGAN
jgi:DNA-binding LacI/PurR family transcriptional regulator